MLVRRNQTNALIIGLLVVLLLAACGPAAEPPLPEGASRRFRLVLHDEAIEIRAGGAPETAVEAVVADGASDERVFAREAERLRVDN